MTPEQFVSVESDRYDADRPHPGGAGVRTITLRALKPGALTVQLRNRRRWEQTVGDPDLEYRIRVET